MRRKSRKASRKRNPRKTRKLQARRNRRRATRRRSRGTDRRHLFIPKTQKQTLLHQKALAVLNRMRRDGSSLAEASRLEGIKSATVLRHVGNALYRSGPGKPWKA